jgi:hypothetical protein
MIIAKAAPAAPLTLTTGEQLVMSAADPVKQICLVSVPGSSSLDLKLFDVELSGTITPNQAGSLTIHLLAMPNDPLRPPTPTQIYPEFTAIATTPAEPVGAAGNFPTTMWSVHALDLMFYLQTGKMQGTWTSNIADHPTPAADLSNALLGLQEDVDPVMYFAMTAFFTPTTPPITTPAPVLTIANFVITGSE